MVIHDNRTIKEQVRSGLLIAFEIVGGFLVFLLASVALAWFFPAGQHVHFPGPLKAWISLLVALAIIFSTAERWAGFIPGFFLVRGIFGGLVYTAFPATSAANSHGLSRIQAGELLIYCLLVMGLLWRFIPPRRSRATTLDRCALTFFALSVAGMSVLSTDRILLAPLSGSIPLLVAWLVYRYRRSFRSTQVKSKR